MIRAFLYILLFGISASAQNADRFEATYSVLNGMTTGEQPYNFKQAVLSVENAYLDGNLDTTFINKRIESLKNLAQAVNESRPLDYKSSDKAKIEKWAAVFKVMCDTITIRSGNETILYKPFAYDFSDAFGHSEWSNMFVSKLLATGKGNCHSLPYLYKILSDELGAGAHLALAPNHVYIKHRSQRDGWYNTELTSGIFPLDSWLMASGYVHIDAVSNGVYMKSLNDKECIALVMIDLAMGYQRKFPKNDGVFILKCCEAALKSYPNFATALILRAETHKAILERENDRQKASTIMADLTAEYQHIHQLGYRNMPEEMYVNWLVSLKTERDKYENKKLNTFNKQ